MDHAIDLTREDRIRYGIRPGMSRIGVWPSDFNEIDSSVARICAEVCAYSSTAIVGWTKGIQWVVFGGHVLNVRMFIGTKRFSFFVETKSVEIYADDGIFPTIALLIEEIQADILAQHERLARCPTVIKDFADATAGLRAETFPRWSGTVTREAKEDPLHQALYAKYEAEYQAAEAGFHKRMRDALFFQCKTRGARYVSIHPTLFCVLEDVKTDGVTSKARRPPDRRRPEHLCRVVRELRRANDEPHRAVRAGYPRHLAGGRRRTDPREQRSNRRKPSRIPQGLSRNPARHGRYGRGRMAQLVQLGERNLPVLSIAGG